MSDVEHPYVSRGGVKLAAALDAFGLDPAGLAAADLGCSVGGFTDCLLQRGAAECTRWTRRTGNWLAARQDDRVVVMERTNALHVQPPAAVDLVVMDLGWTRQERAVPAALRWLRDDGGGGGGGDWAGRIVTLIKPHYEADSRHVLDEAEAEAVTARVLGALPGLGVRVLGSVRSPIRGGRGETSSTWRCWSVRREVWSVG